MIQAGIREETASVSRCGSIGAGADGRGRELREMISKFKYLRTFYMIPSGFWAGGWHFYGALLVGASCPGDWPAVDIPRVSGSFVFE